MKRLPLITLALVAACGTTTSFTPTNTPPRPMSARAPETVEVFTSGQPDRPYVEVGMLEAQQSSEFSSDNMSEIVSALRTEAAKKGCDGLIVTGSNDAVTGNVTDGDGYTTTLKGYRGACIMFKDTDS
jgi:hypothetical protein